MANDLFVFMDSLWNKDQPEGTPPMFVMHRFLASEQDFAPYIRALMKDMSDPKMVAHTWRGILPTAPKAPRLPYSAPKKLPEAEALVARMMEVRKVRRSQAENELEMVEAVGRALELYLEYGVEPPKILLSGATPGKRGKKGKGKTKKQAAPQPPAGGLLSLADGGGK